MHTPFLIQLLNEILNSMLLCADLFTLWLCLLADSALTVKAYLNYYSLIYVVCLQIIQAHYPSLQLLSNRMVQACSSVDIPLRCVYINAEIILMHIVTYCFIAI